MVKALRMSVVAVPKSGTESPGKPAMGLVIR